MTATVSTDTIHTQASAAPAVTARGLSLDEILRIQQQAFLAEPNPTAQVRRDRLTRLKSMLLDHAEDFAEALRQDFGSRPEIVSMLTDITASIPDIDDQRKNVVARMKSKTPAKIGSLLGFHQEVRPEPKGVVGIVGPWNFPLYLILVPAGAALAAGNRVMMRPSSTTAKTTELLARVAPDYFDVDELAVISSEHGRGADFSVLDFDHLFFTGSPEVGKSVAADAAKNLTPVSLELGGKNPVIVSPEFDIDKAATRLAQSRMINGGQVCLCPDYVFVPRRHVDRFVNKVLATWEDTFPTIVGNPDFTATINESNFNRIVSLIDDAKAKGATVRQHVPAGESLPNAAERKIAPTVVTGIGEKMEIAQDEVFGPVLGVYGYDDLSEAVDYVATHPSPLVLYWYGARDKKFDYVLDRTRSGNVYGNDFATGMVTSKIPFGGVGRSGMGSYHGQFGFDTFSHMRAIAVSSLPFAAAEFMVPPFTDAKRRISNLQLKTARLRTKYLG